ncbi:MAG: universal stress protein [Chitinophagaceae bacterium]
MKTILVPTDFSPVSLNAVNYAVEMARSIGADILLVHMYQLPVPFTEVPMPELSYDEIKKAAEERVEELKTHIIQTTAGSLNVLTESRLGDPVEEMEKICDSVHPFAVVMGTQGATGLERLIMGSTALTAIRHLKYPVIVVPAETSYKAIRKLGLACDFQDVEESTPVNYIKNIVQEFGAELHILNVDNNKSGIPENVALKSGYLERRLGNIVPTWHFLEADNVTEGITEFAANNHLDMIMVIPKKHQLLESIFRKSNSKEFLQQSHIPIVSVHD